MPIPFPLFLNTNNHPHPQPIEDTPPSPDSPPPIPSSIMKEVSNNDPVPLGTFPKYYVRRKKTQERISMIRSNDQTTTTPRKDESNHTEEDPTKKAFLKSTLRRRACLSHTTYTITNIFIMFEFLRPFFPCDSLSQSEGSVCGPVHILIFNFHSSLSICPMPLLVDFDNDVQSSSSSIFL